MTTFITSDLTIDRRAVQREVIKQARATLAYYTAKNPAASPTYLEALASHWRREQQAAAAQLRYEQARAARAALSDAERRISDLSARRERVENPLTCPAHLSGVMGETGRLAEVARIDAEIARLSLNTSKDAA